MPTLRPARTPPGRARPHRCPPGSEKPRRLLQLHLLPGRQIVEGSGRHACRDREARGAVGCLGEQRQGAIHRSSHPRCLCRADRLQGWLASSVLPHPAAHLARAQTLHRSGAAHAAPGPGRRAGVGPSSSCPALASTASQRSGGGSCSSTQWHHDGLRKRSRQGPAAHHARWPGHALPQARVGVHVGQLPAPHHLRGPACAACLDATGCPCLGGLRCNDLHTAPLLAGQVQAANLHATARHVGRGRWAGQHPAGQRAPPPDALRLPALLHQGHKTARQGPGGERYVSNTWLKEPGNAGRTRLAAALRARVLHLTLPANPLTARCRPPPPRAPRRAGSPLPQGSCR